MTSTESNVTRREYVGGLATAGAAGIAGCSGLGGRDIDTLRVAHMPIYPDIQSHIMLEEGYFDELPVEVETKIFSERPSIVQASATGDFDLTSSPP